ncbi:MAG: TonB C-terminal domain-containing protein [Deltaproteobacteria bacterium]|nr:TonB C-terminal domain-containing protein [Deltaproteobacteria bacterium]
MSGRWALFACTAALALPCVAVADDAGQCLLEPGVFRYLGRAQDRILDAWELPPDSLANREVVVRLAFDADGKLRDLAILSASDRRLARSVAAAILSAEPFAPIPPDAQCLVGLPIRTTFRNPAD